MGYVVGLPRFGRISNFSLYGGLVHADEKGSTFERMGSGCHLLSDESPLGRKVTHKSHITKAIF